MTVKFEGRLGTNSVKEGVIFTVTSQDTKSSRAPRVTKDKSEGEVGVNVEVHSKSGGTWTTEVPDSGTSQTIVKSPKIPLSSISVEIDLQFRRKSLTKSTSWRSSFL